MNDWIYFESISPPLYLGGDYEVSKNLIKEDDILYLREEHTGDGKKQYILEAKYSLNFSITRQEFDRIVGKLLH